MNTLTKNGERAAKGPLRKSDLEAELATLSTMASDELRRRWLSLTGSAPPMVRHDFLRMALAWELQASVLGGLAHTTLQRLQGSGGRQQTRLIAPGTRLVREWKGVLHTVIVHENGVIIWDGREWASTSAVARAITGTRWSGPVFFGLTKQRRAA